MTANSTNSNALQEKHAVATHGVAAVKRIHRTTFEERRALETLDREALRGLQLERVNRLLERVVPRSCFYATRFKNRELPLKSLEEFAELPFMYKEGLSAQNPSGELANNLTYPLDCYVRFHQTSGTHGRPLVVLDTAEDWQWWIETWQYTLDGAEITPDDRVFMAFSFGPFIGFWSAYDSAVERGCLVIPGGGMSTLQRLEQLRLSKATVLFSTPSYVLHMAEVAAEHNLDLHGSCIRCIVLAGEPGGSIPATRARIESKWGAQVLDHCGATEVGPWGVGDRQGRGVYIIESEFYPEFFSLATNQPAADGELAELVLTNFGRFGSPVVRYRTGDVVRPTRSPNSWTLLEGGLLGRTDDMVVIRGVNIFPSAIESILHGFPEIVEYKILVRRTGEMDEMAIEIEDRLDQPDRVVNELRLRLGLRCDVSTVPLGSLPRFEGKGKRFIDERPLVRNGGSH